MVMHAPFVLTLVADPPNLLVLEALVSPADVGTITATEWLAEGTACDVFLSARPSAAALAQLAARCAAARVDHILQPTASREKKLLISDMDSTMIDQECIDELADMVGLKAHVSAITERAMNGELDFKEALRARVALLKGLPEGTLQEVFEQRITLMAGAATLLATMKARGASTHLVSGGFTFFTARVAVALGFDTHDANILDIEHAALTGTVREPILDKESKLASLRHYAAQHGVGLTETLAVGDGANDLPMLLAAGLGVAYHAKPTVVAQAAASVRFNDLTALLYAQGIPKSAWVG
jgi:phosphoserine phosphatase